MSRARSRARVIKQRIEAFCGLVLIVALTVLALLASIESARSDDGDSRPPSTVTVTTEGKQAPRVADFNDGWRDAKVDDCEQGFKPACDWLRSAK
jgi:hypothetical protein